MTYVWIILLCPEQYVAIFQNETHTAVSVQYEGEESLCGCHLQETGYGSAWLLHIVQKGTTAALLIPLKDVGHKALESFVTLYVTVG
jgi:hypothetical protein